MPGEVHDDAIDGSGLGRRAGEGVVFRQHGVAGHGLDADRRGVGRPAVLQGKPQSGRIRAGVIAKEQIAGRFREEVEFRGRQVLDVRPPQVVPRGEMQFVGPRSAQVDPPLALREAAEAQRHEVVDAQIAAGKLRTAAGPRRSTAAAGRRSAAGPGESTASALPPRPLPASSRPARPSAGIRPSRSSSWAARRLPARTRGPRRCGSRSPRGCSSCLGPGGSPWR